MFGTLVDDYSRAAARLLDIARPAHRTGNQAIPGNRVVRPIEVLDRDALRQRTGIDLYHNLPPRSQYPAVWVK